MSKNNRYYVANTSSQGKRLSEHFVAKEGSRICEYDRKKKSSETSN